MRGPYVSATLSRPKRISQSRRWLMLSSIHVTQEASIFLAPARARVGREVAICHLGVLGRRVNSLCLGTRRLCDMLGASEKYDVALSFAGEQREYVEATAGFLRDAGIRVFYDDYEKVHLWGKNLVEHLEWVYRQASDFCVIFVSEDYAKKAWTTLERRAAQERAMSERAEYILPVRFDDTEVPGLLSTVSYLRAQSTRPIDLAAAIIEKVGPRQIEPVFPMNVDRLYRELGAKGRNSKERRNRQEIRTVAESFYSTLQRMTISERESVCGLLAFGCPAELPAGVHASLDLLARMTRKPVSQILDDLASVRSLNIRVENREPPLDHSPSELVKDDRDLLLTFWSSSVPHRSDATSIVRAMITCATDHYCADHGLDIVTNLDFRNLSASELQRPVASLE